MTVQTSRIALNLDNVKVADARGMLDWLIGWLCGCLVMALIFGFPGNPLILSGVVTYQVFFNVLEQGVMRVCDLFIVPDIPVL